MSLRVSATSMSVSNKLLMIPPMSRLSRLNPPSLLLLLPLSPFFSKSLTILSLSSEFVA